MRPELLSRFVSRSFVSEKTSGYQDKCKTLHMKISFIHMLILINLHLNNTNFHMKGFVVTL